MAAIGSHPCFKLVERFLPERVKTLLSLGAHLNDAGFRQNPKVARHAGLLDVHPLDDVTDGAFARSHRLDDAKARRVGQGMK